jgi:hypothetical protein
VGVNYHGLARIDQLKRISLLKHPNEGVPSFRVPIPAVPIQKLASEKEKENNNE